MDGKQFHWRVRGIAGVLFLILLLFAWVLYDLQYVHGADYLAQSRRKIAKTETVEASRGESWTATAGCWSPTGRATT